MTNLGPKANQKTQSILTLLARGERVLGLWIAMHDRLRCTGIPGSRLQHLNPVCLAIREDHQNECAAFCGGKVHHAMLDAPEGRIHTCPFGVTEAVVPVMQNGLLACILYAGPCWRRRGAPPADGAVLRPARQWLEDRRTVLLALAREVDRVLTASDQQPDDRRTRILTLLQQRLDKSVSLKDVAGHLHLSPSRTGHVIRELFGKSFPALVREVKMGEAAHRLRTSDTPIGTIALDVGYAEQSHFTKLFKRQFGVTPKAYRKRFASGV